jgi:ribose 5-phosphate isomerase A
MKMTGGTTAQKRRAGEAAAELVEDGTVVGLGSGSTAAQAVRAIGERVADGLDVRGVPTSFGTRQLAREAGIPLADLDEVVGPEGPGIDLAIDGADQVADGQLIKGGGAAHFREKVVDSTAERFVVVADPSKEVATLDHPVPVAIHPDAWTVVSEAVRAAGGVPALREASEKDGPVVTDNGNLVLDCDFGAIADPASLATTLSTTAGVVAHGLFVDLADTVYVGTDDGVRTTEL